MSTEEKIVSLVAKLSGKSGVTPESDLLAEIDLDSTAIMELIAEVEDAFQLKLFASGIDVNHLRSPRILAAYLDGLKKGD